MGKKRFLKRLKERRTKQFYDALNIQRISNRSKKPNLPRRNFLWTHIPYSLSSK